MIAPRQLPRRVLLLVLGLAAFAPVGLHAQMAGEPAGKPAEAGSEKPAASSPLGVPVEGPVQETAQPAQETEQPAQETEQPARDAAGALGAPLGEPRTDAAAPRDPRPAGPEARPALGVDVLEPRSEAGGETAPGGALGVPVSVPEWDALRARAVAPAGRPVTFMDRQLTYPRVRTAHERKTRRVRALFERSGVRQAVEVVFRVFKREREFEVWARDRGAPAFRRLKTYPVCQVSGHIGPKRRQGDLQVPEGFYTIDAFNPWSEYHLSLHVNYPNPVDEVRGHRPDLGGDIFIHGGCSTIGCIPVTDEWIEEIYLIALQAREAGQRRIPVHIYPTRLDDSGLDWLAFTFGTQHQDFPFWTNLREGYLAFERTARLPDIDYDGDRYDVRLPPYPLAIPDLPAPSPHTLP